MAGLGLERFDLSWKSQNRPKFQWSINFSELVTTPRRYTKAHIHFRHSQAVQTWFSVPRRF